MLKFEFRAIYLVTTVKRLYQLDCRKFLSLYQKNNNKVNFSLPGPEILVTTKDVQFGTSCTLLSDDMENNFYDMQKVFSCPSFKALITKIDL